MCITSTCIKRLVNDIKHLLKEPIENIYYKHDETNMLIGDLLIIGPNNTPYSCGYNFFIVIFVIYMNCIFFNSYIFDIDVLLFGFNGFFLFDIISLLLFIVCILSISLLVWYLNCFCCVFM